VENRRAGAPGQILKTAVVNAGIRTDYAATAKTSVVGGLSYSDTDRKDLGSDYTDFNVPVNLYYGATEKLDVGVGYRYRKSTVKDTSLGDRISHYKRRASR